MHRPRGRAARGRPERPTRGRSLKAPLLREYLLLLAVHHVPAVLGALERLLLLEARVLEQHARPGAIGLEPVAHARVQKLVDDPREDELALRNALEDLTVDDEAVFELRIRRHAESEVMTDARLEVVRVHPLRERGAVRQRAPDRVGGL